MDAVFILGMTAIALLTFGWIGYSMTTESIIRDQEREISRLKRELRRKQETKNA